MKGFWPDVWGALRGAYRFKYIWGGILAYLGVATFIFGIWGVAATGGAYINAYLLLIWGLTFQLYAATAVFQKNTREILRQTSASIEEASREMEEAGARLDETLREVRVRWGRE